MPVADFPGSWASPAPENAAIVFSVRALGAHACRPHSGLISEHAEIRPTHPPALRSDEDKAVQPEDGEPLHVVASSGTM